MTIKEQETPWHVSLLLSKAQSCVMRDSVSYKYVKKIAPDKTTMYHDFALDVVRDHRLERKITEVSSVEKNYVIVNSHPSLIGKDLMGKIDIFLAKHSDKKIYFFPGDMAHDRQCFEILHKQSSSIQRYDWTKLSLAEILSFVANADEVIAARLHIVFMCHMMRVPYAPLVYQAKVQKVIDDLVAYQKKENEII